MATIPAVGVQRDGLAPPSADEGATDRAWEAVVKTLIELTSDSLNGFGDTVEEWESSWWTAELARQSLDPRT